MRFDHVGVLVPELGPAKAFAQHVLNLGEPVAEFEAPEFGLAGAFFSLQEGRLEVFTLETPGDRLPAGSIAQLDHIAVKVADLDAEMKRLAKEGVTFTGPHTADPVTEPVDLRGGRHLWTEPASGGGYRLQIIEG